MAELRFDPNQARLSIVNKVTFGRQAITVAKSFILNSISGGRYPNQGQGILVDTLKAGFLAYMSKSAPRGPVFERSEESEAYEAKLAWVAQEVGWTAAVGEAVLELIHNNVLMVASNQLTYLYHRVNYTHIQSAGSSVSAGWDFDDFTVVTPHSVRLTPSAKVRPEEFLPDTDLFLERLGIPDLHELVAEALREAARCFRYELYTACLAMLLKGIEQAWIELGAALADAIPARSEQAASKLRRTLENPEIGLLGKIQAVTNIFDKKDILGSIWESSGHDNRSLREAAAWVDQVRDARNVLHPGVIPWVPNTYEKVGVLMMATIPHLRTIYRITSAARSLAAGHPH